jgi:L,D-peptidoglycan transpeptidase YkuD (ErfK/YbiS/YcfS/YnhG family)
VIIGGFRRIVVKPSVENSSRGMLAFGRRIVPCALGRGGVTWRKREGDGATPAGPLPFLFVYYRADRVVRPLTRLPVAAIRRDSGWCDDPGDRNYNRPVRLPFDAGHELMWRDDRLYDLVVVLDYNFSNPRAGAGSAIFLHLASPGMEPTAGCVAVGETAMRQILAGAADGTQLVVG